MTDPAADVDVGTLRDALAAIDSDEPPALELAEQLAQTTGRAVGDAQGEVYDAIDAGVLVEHGDGWGGVALAAEYREGDDTPNMPDTAEESATEAGERDGPGGLPGYAELLREAQTRAGRDPWEPVEEATLREVLDEYGLAHLLNDRVLGRTGRWRRVDTSDDGEDPRLRWYYPTGDEPRPDEFRRFDALLTDAAPEGYQPHYFRVARAGKDPATQFGSWKRDEARLTVDEAVEWMQKGGNVGVAGRGECKICNGEGALEGDPCDRCDGTGDLDGPLVNVDIDDDEETTPEDVPTSLRARSRSRTGWHTWYFDTEGDIPNISTDTCGEVRADWQYVVAPGSFVTSTTEDIPDGADDAGYYTVEEAEPVAQVEYDELPEVFLEAAEEAEEVAEQDVDAGVTNTVEIDHDSEDRPDTGSDVFDIDADALVSADDPNERFTSIFHNSSTGANMSVSDGKVHCWRHGVAHGGLQALAVLSDKVSHGCRQLGKGHKNSGVGRNHLKGDWRLVWAAWHYAKRDGHLDTDDPLPYRVLLGLAVEAGVVDSDEDFVDRATDTGEVVDNPDEYDGDTYTALPSGAYNEVLAYAEEQADVPLGREPVEGTADREDDAEDDDPRDLLALDVVVEPANALAAAGAVEPADLGDEADLPELEREDVADVAIAVALREGWIDTPDEFPEDGRYTEAYYRARDRFGAPLPKYLDNSTLEERTELVFAALDRVRPEHVLDALNSDITVADPAGEAIAKINPTWEESNSGERILAGYGAGFYCTEHSPHQPKGNHTFDALQVVALEHGLVEDEFTRPSGEAFKQAYRLLREKYDAPVPRWRATLVETVPVLPPAVRLLDDDVRVSDSASETLQEARDRTEALVRDAVGVRTRGQLITALPGTGKTYSAIAAAADRPTLYVTRRNDLKTQAEEYAAEIAADDDHHPDAEPSVVHLPILAENVLPDAAVREGVAAVREEGFDLLRDRHEELYERVAPELEDDSGDTNATDDDTVDLDRGTCETAEGEYGDRWRVRVHIARALGLQPADLHRADEAVFGEPLPCQCDDHGHGEGDTAECELSVAWDRIRDPDRPLDLLVGSPEHAFVDSATTYYERDADGDRVVRERAVVIDEFPEESYFSQYAGRYMDHATWLAEALVDIDTREDLLAADLAADTWVDRWLDGEGGEYGAAADAIDAVAAAADVADATDHAADILDSGRLDAVAGVTSANLRQLRATLETVADADPDADLGDAVDTLNRAVDRVKKDAAAAYADGRDAAGEAYALVDDLKTTLDALTRGLDAVDTGETGLLETVRERVATLPVGGDLRALLEDAVDATRGDGPAGILDAATTALRGGRDGCRELALFANGGYAHPDAWAHLAGAIADADHDDVREVSSEAFTFDPEREGGRFKRFTRNGARILADKNHHGELVVDPPAFTDATGSTCPVIGLDATGRPELWKIAIGRDTERRDIHQTDAERRRFLRDTVDLTVVQTADSPLPYHGPPDGQNFQEDLALVREVAAEYTEGADALDDKGPAVMSTQKVLTALEDDLAPHAGATVEYESLKGSDALGDHQVAVILGSQHYSDAVPEKWGLVAGESPGRGDTKGAALDYGTDVANAYLQYMREDHTMQAILRAGRNDDTTVVFAHTSALRADLPVDAESALVSAHSKGTLQVVEAAAELRGGRFTAPDVAEALGADGVGLRQVQNVLADLRESGYVDVREAGSRGRAYEYDSVEDPGLAEVELPNIDTDTGEGENETSALNSYSWNFGFDAAARGGDTPREAPGPTIPASTAVDPAETEAGPPG